MNENSMYRRDLDKGPANWATLTPASFLLRAGRLYADRIAVVHGARRFTYGQFLERARRLASALVRAGIRPLDTVAVLAPNIPEMLEAHNGVPMAGAVICPINVRLDAASVGFILRHSEARVLLVDREFGALARAALLQSGTDPLVVDIDDPEGPGGPAIGSVGYEAFLAAADPADPMCLPADEWSAVALGYTSGTTGNPKGVVTHHRGAYLNAAAIACEFQLGPESVYLWTLPMFHCNGWCFTWTVTLAGGTHVCLRRVDPALIFPAIAAHGVTHMCGAPVVLTTLIHAPDAVRRRPERPVRIMTGGAAPPSAVIARMEAGGFIVHHLYGLTETYGPSMVNAWQPGMDALPLAERASFMARQGVGHAMIADYAVLDPDDRPVPADGRTLGELALRGNTVMMGYLKNPAATASAFRNGWFHTGDLAVLHPDGYVEVKDRSKDIIISGGENISSLEVEEALTRHPEVMEAAVVAHPDARWGEVPHAFVSLRPAAEDRVSAAELVAWCRDRIAHFKCPRHVSFGPLPKTSTGKVQKYALRETARAMQEVAEES